jgi:proteasome lid subunit RPN8/RPN11
MKRKDDIAAQPPKVLMDADVLRQIRQHARSSNKAEVCGILIGNDSGRQVEVEACIAGVNAAQGGAHVTFTQDTWEHIYKIKDAEYPDDRMVGWYHSHPGFGVFLSDHDTFIHQNFFSSPLQVAWVYDPHSDEEGCFGWVGKRLERLPEIAITDRRGGELANESGKAEPVRFSSGEEEEPDQNLVIPRSDQESAAPWMNWTVTILSYLCTAAIGCVVAWFFFPHILIYLVDPRTMQPIGLYDPHTGQVVLDTQPPPNLEPGKLMPPASVPASPDQAAPPATSPGNKDDKGKHAER